MYLVSKRLNYLYQMENGTTDMQLACKDHSILFMFWLLFV